MAGVINDPSDIKIAQRLLSTLDYGVLSDSGVLDEPTKVAIKKARADLKLPMSVNVDDQLLEALSKERATRGARNVAIALGVAALAAGAGLYWMYRSSASKAEEADEYEPVESTESHGKMAERARSYLGKGELPFLRASRKISEASLPTTIAFRALSASKAEGAKKTPSFYERNKEGALVFGRGFVDEAALGLIDPVIEYSSEPQEREAWKKTKEKHKLANVSGRAAGFGTSLLYGGGEVKAAVTGGRLLARGAEKVAVRGAEKIAARGVEKAAVKAAERGATRGLETAAAKRGIASLAARIAKLKAAGISARIAEEIALRGGEDFFVDTGVQGITRGAQIVGSKVSSS